MTPGEAGRRKGPRGGWRTGSALKTRGLNTKMLTSVQAGTRVAGTWRSVTQTYMLVYLYICPLAFRDGPHSCLWSVFLSK